MSTLKAAGNVGRGGLIGLVEIVPGVSGGTVALIIGVYEALIYLVPFCAAYPFLATAAGTGAGMFVNFGLSRRLVFR